MPFYLKEKKKKVELPGHKERQVFRSPWGILSAGDAHLNVGPAPFLTVYHPEFAADWVCWQSAWAAGCPSLWVYVTPDLLCISLLLLLGAFSGFFLLSFGYKI